MSGFIDRLDWIHIATQLDQEGYARLPGMLDHPSLGALHGRAASPNMELATPLAAQNAGHGDQHFFRPPLCDALAAWRELLYHRLAPIANRWNEVLDVAFRYPADPADFLAWNRQAGQTGELSHLNVLREHGHQALQQRMQEPAMLPLQLVGLLSTPGKDFTGGEFVMVEQRPRMQSRPIVVSLARGDAALIATAQRPVKGTKGYYRVNLKHAISRVRSGQRVGLELVFHHGR